jgi:hypothetical protein
MILSTFTLLYFYFLQFIEKFQKITSDKSIRIFSFIMAFILLQILRVYGQSSFPDIPNYNLIFNEIRPLSFVLKNGYGLEYYEESEEYGSLLTVPIETGFSLLISLFKLFSSNFNLFLFFVSLFQLSTFYFFCRKKGLNLLGAVMAYVGLTYITFQIGMIRQSIAFCFFLFALLNLNKKTNYILLIFLGFTFHRSALFCLVFIWSNIFINRKIIYFVSIFSLFIYLFQIDFMNDFFKLVTLADIFESGRLDFYLNVDRSNNYLGIGFWERVFLLFIINLAYLDLLKKGLVTSSRNIFYNLSFALIIIQLFFFSSPTITSRLRYYLILFPILFLLDYIRLVKDENLKNVYQFAIFLYLQAQIYFLSTYLM